MRQTQVTDGEEAIRIKQETIEKLYFNLVKLQGQMKDGHMRMSIYDNSKINSNKIISFFCVLSVKCLVLYVVHPCIVRSALGNLCVLSILYIMYVQCLSCVESELCSCTGCVLSFLCGNSVPFVRVLAL